MFAEEDNKIRDHDHVTGKYRNSMHWHCNIYLRWTKKILIFHNLRGYHSPLIMQETGKFNVKINVMQNGLEQLMAFTINRNLVFTDSVHFMNSSLDELVKDSLDNDSKYLS